MSTNTPISITKLILLPSILSLAITALRLIGELQNWNPTLFNREPGGGGALLGISWLMPIVGIYFAYKLIHNGETPETSSVRVLLFALLGIVLMVLAFFTFGQNPSEITLPRVIGGLLLMIAAAVVQFLPWRKLSKALLAYAFAARIPVAILMFFAIRGNWGTHYDVAPPNFPEMNWFSKYLLIGFVPQMIVWVVTTIVIGALTAGITAAIMQRGKAATTVEA